MGPVSAVARSIEVRTRQTSDSASPDVSAAAAEPSRALVALTPAAQRRDIAARGASAAFLTQLLAAKQNVPQARERRRAEPREAIAAYVAAASVIRAL